MIKEEIYQKWEKKYGKVARLALDITYQSTKELGRLFLTDIINHINDKNCIIIDKNNFILYHYLKRKNKMKLSIILSKDKKGSVMLNELENICIERQIPAITLTVIKGIDAEQWYYKKGFKKVNERKSKKGTNLLDLEKIIIQKESNSILKYINK